MDSQAQFCHNVDCPARGQVGQGNIGVHSRQAGRYIVCVDGLASYVTASTRSTPPPRDHDSMGCHRLTPLAHNSHNSQNSRAGRAAGVSRPLGYIPKPPVTSITVPVT